ncbi:hypothetical protein ACJMK2_033990 [Sinanodonta woodiana]|uniref:DUF3456 domain-containing protein n=1 Tax=Sinanodonta woodiana TaxID=1069815 RepID=A0ABD3WTN9_SINWO
MRVEPVLRGIIIFSILIPFVTCAKGDEDEGPVKEPTLCEACKYMVLELKGRLEETGKSKEVLRTGHGLETKKKEIKYNKAELRLIEALQEPHVCDRILEYDVHKERKGSLRFAKGRSQTMSTLQNLVNKGVKVELGIPYQMWNDTPAEVSHLQRQCFKIVEEYEDDIEEWFYNHQDQDLMEYLCKNIVLKNDDSTCLSEVPEIESNKEKGSDSEKEPSKEKKSKKKKTSKPKDPEKAKGDFSDMSDEKPAKVNDEL